MKSAKEKRWERLRLMAQLLATEREENDGDEEEVTAFVELAWMLSMDPELEEVPYGRPRLALVTP